MSSTPFLLKINMRACSMMLRSWLWQGTRGRPPRSAMNPTPEAGRGKEPASA